MTALLDLFAAALNSLWQAALLAMIVWLALRALPGVRARFNAATRYVIWWAVLGVVLVLPAGPGAIAWWHARSEPSLTMDMRPARPVPSFEIFERPPVTVTVTSKRAAAWPYWILGLWWALCLYRLGQIARSYFYLRGVKRRASIAPRALPLIRRRATLLSSDEVRSPMAVGFLKPAVILPGGLTAQITPQELDHVLLHEAAHLARGDDWANLAARLLGAATALHPVAWWILRQIERERETACDDWVVARTGEARPYAASLARMFELRASRGEAGEALASGMLGGGSRIGERIELLLQRGRNFSGRSSAARVTAASLSLLALLAGASLAPRWIAFAETRPEFEAASVRLNPEGRGAPVYGPQGIRFTGVSLALIIAEAYDLPPGRVIGPDSLNKETLWIALSTGYDIEATAGHAVPKSELRRMLQTLLENRFELRLHAESKIQPVYKLVLGKNALKLEEAGSEGGFSASNTPDGVAFHNATMARLIGFLRVDRPVVDETGLTGAYNFTLRIEPREGVSKTDPAPEDPFIFGEIQKLGLKLEAARVAASYPVIDRLEKPDAN
jgi:uncharacterized protein (TIGR03435 family)